MPQIILQTQIYADIETCFDLSRSIDFHLESLEHSHEKAVAGKTSGLINLGESVTWEAVHFGIKQRLTSKITQFNRPYYFVDEMVTGAFKSFTHVHKFEEQDGYTLMTDTFQFESPLGIIGKLVNVIVLQRYVTKLLKIRNNALKSYAERS